MDKERQKRTSKELLRSPSGPGVPLIKDIKPLQTFKAKDSAVLSQVKTFLPALVNANKALHETMKKEGREQVDIECVEEQKRHIEMDLAIIPLDCEDLHGDSCDDSDKEEILLPIKLLSSSDLHKNNAISVIEELK